MRTTVTLDPDVEALVKAAMAEQHLTFKDAVNQAIRAGRYDAGASSVSGAASGMPASARNCS